METLVLEGREGLKRFVGARNGSKNIKTPFGENDILYLQNAFTTPGVHAIKVQDVKTGRKLVTQLLNSLKWYQDVAYLASSESVPYKRAKNIFAHITQPITVEGMAQFFIENFYYDFLWIEATQELLKEPWLSSFEQQLVNYHIDHMIPIIVISYD
jgi:hypothetical protein